MHKEIPAIRWQWACKCSFMNVCSDLIANGVTVNTSVTIITTFIDTPEIQAGKCCVCCIYDLQKPFLNFLYTKLVLS